MEDFDPELQVARKRVLRLPPQEPVVAVVGTIVEPIAAIAVRLKFVAALLQRERQKELIAAVTEPAIRISGR